jgi:hypothetical protein
MFPICPFQFRVFVDQAAVKSNFKIPVTQVFQKQIKLPILSSDHLQYPLHRILIVLNALLTSPWRGYTIFHISNLFRW